MKKVISIDLGASNGRLILAKLKDNILQLEELHRFKNEPIEKNNHLFWDINYIYQEIEKGLKKYTKNYQEPLHGIGIDTWGVDLGFISDKNKILENPCSYRDTYTVHVMEEVHEKIAEQALFEKTGVEPASINTLYQLFAIQKNRPELLKDANVILTLPSLVNFLLTGEKYNEFTHASTTQLLHIQSKDWNQDLMEIIFGNPLPLAKIKQTNSIYGHIKDELKKEIGVQIENTPVINVPGHDTACALVAMGRKSKETAFMSCGTWVLIGIEGEQPIISDDCFRWGFTNEGTADQTYRLQKNNMGLWLLQQCKKEWSIKGESISYEEESELMLKTSPFQSLINPDDEMFFNPPSMIQAIQSFCKQTNQVIPQTKGEIIRCILESLALKYRWVLERLEELSNRKIPSIHMAGGAIQNKWFCQFTANATNKQIQTGPVEASAIGNALSQFFTLGEFEDLQNARKIVNDSFETNEYVPKDVSEWDQIYEKFIKYL